MLNKVQTTKLHATKTPGRAQYISSDKKREQKERPPDSCCQSCCQTDNRVSEDVDYKNTGN